MPAFGLPVHCESCASTMTIWIHRHNQFANALSSDSFSLASSTSTVVTANLYPFATTCCCSHLSLMAQVAIQMFTPHHQVYTTSTRVPALITILSSLDTPTKSNTTKTHKRNQKMRGASFFGDDDVLDESTAQSFRNPNEASCHPPVPFIHCFPDRYTIQTRMKRWRLESFPRQTTTSDVVMSEPSRLHRMVMSDSLLG